MPYPFSQRAVKILVDFIMRYHSLSAPSEHHVLPENLKMEESRGVEPRHVFQRVAL